MLLQFELIKWCDHSKSVTITILCRYNTYHIIMSFLIVLFTMKKRNSNSSARICLLLQWFRLTFGVKVNHSTYYLVLNMQNMCRKCEQVGRSCWAETRHGWPSIFCINTMEVGKNKESNCTMYSVIVIFLFFVDSFNHNYLN